MTNSLYPREAIGSVDSVCAAPLPARAGASLGRVLRSRVFTAKGFFFQPRQYVQRPCVQGLGGALCLVMHLASDRVVSSLMNEANHGADAKCPQIKAKSLHNLESAE